MTTGTAPAHLAQGPDLGENHPHAASAGIRAIPCTRIGDFHDPAA
jgi:hypothetical protein